METHPNFGANELLSPNWLELPREVTLSILEKLDAFDILENVQRVCTQWKSICKDPSLWRTVTIVLRWNYYYGLDMSRQAVDLSCGGLIYLNLTDCCDEQFLDYVTQRCTQIRRLRLVRVSMSDAGLCEAAKRLPLLEDLEISYCYRAGYAVPPMNDSVAIAIAENMVELRHLQLFGNRLTNNGLKAILDSCSHLEFLDLRQCFNINLDNSSLGKICAERVKDFRAPYDLTDDYEFDETLYEDEYDDYDGPLTNKDVDYMTDSD